MSGRCRGCAFSGRRAAFVDPRVTTPEAAEDFIADSAEMVSEFVDRDALANQCHHVASPRGILFDIGDVDAHQVHRDPACDRATPSANHHLGPACAVATAAGAEIAIGITGGDDGQFGWTASGPRAAIADGLALLDVADV